jgi:MFS family permease
MSSLSKPNTALAPIRESFSEVNLRHLFLGRALRSLSLGYLNIIVPIYLVSLGYSAVRIGVVFTAGSLGSMALTAAVGLLADRVGRKPLLITLGLLTSTSGLLFAIAPGYGMLLFAAAIGTIGRGGGAGSSGSFGPYFPAEQALIAEHAGDERRTSAFGVVSLVGVLAGSAGSLVATTPSLLHRIFGLSSATGERALFLLTTVIGLAMALIILPVSERPRVRREPGAPRLGEATRRMLPRFMITNATNGIAVGMLGPVLVYWFHVRFGATSAELGALYFLANIAAAPSNAVKCGTHDRRADNAERRAFPSDPHRGLPPGGERRALLRLLPKGATAGRAVAEDLEARNRCHATGTGQRGRRECSKSWSGVVRVLTALLTSH